MKIPYTDCAFTITNFTSHEWIADYSMVMVPNPTKSRAFTLDEMIYATQNFSMEIGRGGFGSVFFGKLADEKDIAVKVLSVFSHQGVLEFLNEVLLRYYHVIWLNLDPI
jgi:hypothetical protein